MLATLPATLPPAVGLAWSDRVPFDHGDVLLRRALRRAGAPNSVTGQRIDRSRDAAPKLKRPQARTRRNPTGQPAWTIGLSHSGTAWLAVAAFERPIGVDLERLRPRDFDRLNHFLGWLDDSGTSIGGKRFYQRWTLAEALFKAGATSAVDCYRWSHRWVSGLEQQEPVELAQVGRDKRRWHCAWRAPAHDSLACIVWSDPI